jgi:hypothetical protein
MTEPVIRTLDRTDSRTAEQKVFGDAVEFHPVTGLPLEAGSGALRPDLQAMNVHLPLIAERDGAVAAAVMREKLKTHMAAKAEAVAAEIKSKMEN